MHVIRVYPLRDEGNTLFETTTTVNKGISNDLHGIT